MIERSALLKGFAAAFVSAACGPAVASAPATTMTITLKDHTFSPSALRDPAGQPLRIAIVNRDATAEEIDGDALGWDKPIAPHGKVVLTVSPLKPGSYAFAGEFHPKTAGDADCGRRTGTIAQP